MAERSNHETQEEMVRSVFEVDCTAVIPQCGYQCSQCRDEMRRVFESMRGVTAFYTEGEGKKEVIVVEHDSVKVPTEQLRAELEQLPSRYPGTFRVASVETARP